jgi:hypothetical protein
LNWCRASSGKQRGRDAQPKEVQAEMANLHRFRHVISMRAC